MHSVITSCKTISTKTHRQLPLKNTHKQYAAALITRQNVYQFQSKNNKMLSNAIAPFNNNCIVMDT